MTKQFETAARRGTPAMADAQPVTFLFDEREMTAAPPTSGQLALFTASQSEGGIASIRALFDLLSWVLDDADYKVIETALEEGLDLDVITEIVQYLISEWSARPTSASTGSSPSRRSTGTRSTVKPLRAASTTSP
jgi:hypothetical protein